MKNKLPSCLDYDIFLNKAASKFNISTNEARDKYGLYTYEQWQKLLKKHYQNEKYRQKERFYPRLAVCTPNRAIIQRMPQKSVGKYQTQNQNE